MNGTVLAVTVFSQLQVLLSCILLATTIFRAVHQDYQGVQGFSREGLGFIAAPLVGLGVDSVQLLLFLIEIEDTYNKVIFVLHKR